MRPVVDCKILGHNTKHLATTRSTLTDSISTKIHSTKSVLHKLPLQAWMPSAHVWSKFLSPTSPQFLNQAPPREQQLGVPDLLIVPHLGHLLLLISSDRLDVIDDSVGVRVANNVIHKDIDGKILMAEGIRRNFVHSRNETCVPVVFKGKVTAREMVVMLGDSALGRLELIVPMASVVTVYGVKIPFVISNATIELYSHNEQQNISSLHNLHLQAWMPSAHV